MRYYIVRNQKLTAVIRISPRTATFFWSRLSPLKGSGPPIIHSTGLYKLILVWRCFIETAICVAVCRMGEFVGIFFLVLLMIIKLDFKRFNMLFLDSCQPSQFFLYNFLKIENLSRFQIKQLRKWTLNNRVLRASTRTKCVFNKTEVSHLFHTISLVPVMQSRSAM